MGEPLRRRELSRLADLLAGGDLETASLGSTRLLALFPLDAEVRVQAAAVASAHGDTLQAGAHLFLAPGATAIDSAALAEFETLVARDPLAAFWKLGLRDVPADDALQPEPRDRLAALLEELERRDHARPRLDALLYASRRDLNSSERRHALGCLALFGFVCLGILALAALGLASLR